MENLRKNTILQPGQMIKDIHPGDIPANMPVHTHAINAALNKLGKIVPEKSTLKCGSFPAGYDPVGVISLTDRIRSAVFLAGENSSEIGIFSENDCTYVKVVNDPCLNFKKNKPITGASKQNFKCEEETYFVDGDNPNRVINFDNIPYKYTIKTSLTGCDEKIFSDDLDCQELLWTPKLSYPVLTVSRGFDGNLRNGAYQFAAAYSENKQRLTEWFGVTDPAAGIVFSHDNRGKSLTVEIDNLDRDFNEFALAVIYTVNQQTTVEIVGFFSTGQNRVVVSKVGNIAPNQIPIALSDLTQQSIFYEKADSMVASNGYALLVSPTRPRTINYQPQANKITAKWVAVKKPLDYYAKGGTDTGLPRDENIALGIQFLYTSGHWTSTYAVCGRTPLQSERQKVNGPDIFEYELDNPPKKVPKWQAYNTATVEKTHNTNELLSEGKFGHYESVYTYPDNEFIWEDNACLPLRFHKVPGADLVPLTDGENIILIGVQLEGIEHPKDENGQYITDIVGYRIVIGDTTNEKSVLANGIIMNMGQYEKDEKTFLYGNYPANDLRPDPYLSTTLPTRTATNKERNYTPLGNYRKDIFTFHSPETSFAQPTLGSEFRIYNELFGESRGNFEHVYKHPRHKLIRNFALLAAAAVGFGEGILATKGKTVYEKQAPTKIKLFVMKETATDAGLITTSNIPSINLDGITDTALRQIILAAGGNVAPEMVDTIIRALKGVPKEPLGPTDTGLVHGTTKITTETAYQNIPIIAIGAKTLAFGYFFMQGVSTALNVIKAFINYEQYAYQFNTHAYLDNTKKVAVDNVRRGISHYEYLYPIQQEANGFTINNYKRSSSVALFLHKDIANPTTQDNSRQTISTAGICNNKLATVSSTVSCFYGAVKKFLPNQYGQIDGILYRDLGYKDLVLTNVSTDPAKRAYNSAVILGGGKRVTRMTFKNKMHFFNQTEFQEQDGHEFDYTQYINVAFPRYWMNSQEYDVNELLKFDLPTDKHNLDCRATETLAKKISAPFLIKNAAFYLFCNGVLDFFVESDYDLSKRDWEDTLEGRHYDEKTYTDLSSLFRQDIYDYDNKYIYDKSFLKVNEENYIPIQDQTETAINLCGEKFDNRVAYSLPAIQGGKKDNWRYFLPNNHWDFPKENGKITGVFPLGETNILFTFENGAPYLHNTTDTIQLGSGKSVSIGDSGLFARQPQSQGYTEYAYGSNQSRFAYCSTEFGLVYVSQRNGTVFLYNGKLNELTGLEQSGMYYWFKDNLPSRLLMQFPEFPDSDNPFTGIGIISVFDPLTKMLYISKKDYKAKANVTWTGERFEFKGIPIELGDLNYFDDCSWTVSMYMKKQWWVSFHDWHPDWLVQTNSGFLAINDGQVWRHNAGCEDHCVFYGVKRPYEIELVVNNSPNNEILSSISYKIDAVRHKNNCKDAFKILDYNFNRLIVYNDEQISGMLRMFLKGKRGPSDLLTYPRTNTDSIDILYDKVEGEIRVNMFSDITRDRGEFTGKEVVLLNNAENGYNRSINPVAVNYSKRQNQRKKFRNGWHKIILRRVPDADPMPEIGFNFSIVKEVISPR